MSHSRKKSKRKRTNDPARPSKARKTTKHEPNQTGLNYSQGVGPLLLGKRTESGDLGFHFEYTSDVEISQDVEFPRARTARRFRMQLGTTATIALFLVLLTTYGAVHHDENLVQRGLQAIEHSSALTLISMRSESMR
jgi:hypothetical protein